MPIGKSNPASTVSSQNSQQSINSDTIGTLQGAFTCQPRDVRSAITIHFLLGLQLQSAWISLSYEPNISLCERSYRDLRRCIARHVGGCTFQEAAVTGKCECSLQPISS